MYHPDVVQQRLVELARHDRDNHDVPKWLRFDPVDRTREECEQFAQAYASLQDEDGELTRPLYEEEHAWIRHEHLRCTVDFVYWLTRYAKINDFTGKLTHFSPNHAQRMVIGKWAEMEIANLAIMMIQLKARQLGVTTLTEAAITHRVQFYPDVNAAVASASPDQSNKMAHMMELCLDSQPDFLKPRKTAGRAGKLIEFKESNSAVSIQHGSQFNGLSRGSTPTVVHLSEVSTYIDAEGLIEASLLRAIHETPWVFVILESTADGLHGYWPRKWKESKKGWPGNSRFMPVFLPWFVGTDLYPTETWLRKQPIPVDWVPSRLVCSHADRAELYVKCSSMLTAALGNSWVMSREQMWFYESEYKAAKDNKLLNKFLSEMPADEDEAFQSTNQSAFEPETIQLYRDHTRRKPPLAVFGLRGSQDEIPLRQQPVSADIDTSLPIMPITCAWSTQLQSSYELVPLKFHGYDDTDPHGKLFIWEWPTADDEYAFGVDTADGRGLDGSAIEMMRKGTVFRGPGQVAEFCSSYINAFNLFPFTMAIGTLYASRRVQPRAVIECRGNGEVVQVEMRKRGWNQFHQWMRYDGKNLDPSTAHKLGWFTNSWSRDIMMDMLLSALNDEWMEVNSPYFVQEMTALSRDEGEQSFRADYGGHDDRIMGVGMPLVSLHILEMKSFRSRRLAGERMTFQSRRPDIDPSSDDPVYDPGHAARDVDTRPMRSHIRTMRKAYTDLARQQRIGR